MPRTKEDRQMKPAEIEELLRLKAWSRRELGAALDLSENIVHRWISGERTPGGPASILMRMWLNQARIEESKRLARLLESQPA